MPNIRARMASRVLGVTASERVTTAARVTPDHRPACVRVAAVVTVAPNAVNIGHNNAHTLVYHGSHCCGHSHCRGTVYGPLRKSPMTKKRQARAILVTDPLFNDTETDRLLRRRDKCIRALIAELQHLPMDQQYSILTSWMPLNELEEATTFICSRNGNVFMPWKEGDHER